MILTIIAMAFSLAWLKAIMIPFVLAVFVVLMLTPVIDVQRRFLKIPYSIAVFTSFLLGAIFIFIVYLFISSSILQILPYIDTYESKIRNVLNRLASSLPLDKFDIDQESLLSPLVQNTTRTIGLIFKGVMTAILGLLSRAVLVLIFVLFLLMGRPAKANQNTTWQKAESKIKHYITTKFGLSVFLGLVIGVTLKILGIDMAFVFGVAAFILNFIPTLGPILATLLPLPVVLFNVNVSLITGFLAIIIPGMIQFVFGNIVEPKVMGDALDLHPVVVLMALIFWGMLWGIVGMFLAVPLTAIIKLILEDFEQTRPLANLMAGRFD